MIYIFDIDGTLADISHRLHFIKQDPKDWKAFYSACPEDKPIGEIVEIARALQVIHSIALITGRSLEIARETGQWVNDQGVYFSELLMRKQRDYRQDYVVKEELLAELILKNPSNRIAGVFEDRKQVVDMYRAKGLRVFQVADGDF
jgi:FMN phosphatase YigB (HAD superfamily)